MREVLAVTQVQGAPAASKSARPPLRGVDPIRLAGAIQPHGFLLGVDLASFEVSVVSENVVDYLGLRPAAILGRTLTDLLGVAAVERLPISDPAGGPTEPRSFRLRPVARAAERRAPTGQEPWNEFEVVAHRSGDLRILEFELVAPAAAATPVAPGAPAPVCTDEVLRLCDRAVAEIRELTGYDRVWLIRCGGVLDESDEIIAEAIRFDLDLFLGRSVRRSITRRVTNHLANDAIRVVNDVAAEPVRLVCSLDEISAVGVDLSMCSLSRPADPEIRQVRSIGTAAFMTLALIDDGRLWGLIHCSHLTRLRVSRNLWEACATVARVLSHRVHAAHVRLEREQAAHLGDRVAEVVQAMSLGSSLAAGAAEVPEALLAIVAADGVVLEVDGRRIAIGRTPTPGDVDALLNEVATLADCGALQWSTDDLPDLLAAVRAGRGTATGSVTGLLYREFAPANGGFVLWVRDDGAPDGPPARGAPAGAASPASHDSSSVFAETTPDFTRPWLPAERAAAETFAKALPALLLQRAQRVLVEQRLAASAERLTAAAEKLLLEHQLQQHQRLESLGQLAGGIAHDFNNLLAVMLNYAEFAGDQVGAHAISAPAEDWHRVEEDIEQIKGAARRAAELTHRLLAFARREVVRPRALSLNAVVAGLEQLLQRTIGDHVRLTTDLGPNLRRILADPGQIEQILVNLAVNARDAMPGGGTLSITTADVDRPDPGSGAADSRSPAPSGSLPGQFVELRVRDTGTGISQDVIERIFEPFFTTKATGEGTGLGLATVHGIVNQAGGVIEITSEPGRGTTFTMVFPATRILPEVPRRAVPRDTSRTRGGTVLIVEDRDDLRAVTHRVLTGAGYEVLAVANGNEAIEIAAQATGPADLLLTDLIMPMMTGDEVSTRIRELWPDVRVLFMSGYAGPVVANGVSLELDYPLLNKPFSRSDLLGKVREVFDLPPLRIRTGPRRLDHAH